MNFSRFLDIQSWWEVPSIAYFCSLFRTAFNLLDFDIEELEEALLTDGTEESASSLLTELIVRLLKGCLSNNDISAFNYQMYLRRLFRRKCQETSRYNPFNTDIDFQFLPLRTKVEILYALCDFRLDAEDVFDLFKNLEAESLRVEPLGWDDNDSAYWYFYGTRLYREDLIKKPKGKSKKKKKESRKRGWFYGDDWLDDDETERVWQVVCFTEEDWTHLTAKFRKATSKVEKELYRSLSQNFLPEIPRLFQEKERLQRKRLLELAPRRTSSRVLQKIKQKEEEDTKQGAYDSKEDEDSMETPVAARAKRAKRRDMLRSKSVSSDSSESSAVEQEETPHKSKNRGKARDKRSKSSSSAVKGETPPEPIVRTGRKTNNSLASATGQIVIPDNDEPVNSTRKKLKTSQIFSQTEEDIQTDMYKVLEQLTNHDDAWPFMDPVEEEYAPNYYAVIRRPMDLRTMEERLDNGHYTDFSMFKADFKLIVNNCRLYNGQDNEYTTMVDNLQAAFDRLTEKYIHRVSSSDEEIAVEYQIPTPSRKHKLKSSESPERHKRKKRKSNSSEPASAGESKSSSTENIQDEEEEKQYNEDVSENKKNEESHRNKHDKVKKKRKGHHRHGKHSKNHKRNHRSNHESKKHNKKHGRNKDRESKKSKQKRKKNKHQEIEPPPILKRSESQESLESSNRSRSASPLPSIHTPSPSPTELDKPEQNNQGDSDPDFLKDKFDKIKERRRHANKEEAWDSLIKEKPENQKQNVPDKNQKLRETIEKLKAKNEQYKETAAFNNLLASTAAEEPNSSKDNKDSTVSKDTKSTSKEEKPKKGTKNAETSKAKSSGKRAKKSSAKNASASAALEQAVIDISKWLDEAPKGSALSSPSISPAQTTSTEDQDNSRLDDDGSQGERNSSRKDTNRKRPSSREPKTFKRREIQRTIDRLQPGKSKGNLLTNMANKNTEKVEEATLSGTTSKPRDSNKDESSPKLSLGSVLPTVDFTLGKDHNFSNDEAKKDNVENEQENIETTEIVQEDEKVELVVEKQVAEVTTQPTKRDVEVETDPQMLSKPSQEKATPNLSAWFKAFGTPKASTSNTPAVKKKVGEVEYEGKAPENTNAETTSKITSPKGTVLKMDSPYDANSPLHEGGDSPHLNVMATPRQRRTSTGSTISERSSFSQDLDSPRHQMSHNSPLLSSPASPRTDDFQKITYPIINGTVRAGFYQDTTSLKSSPDKSCSPREGPQSPYSPYSQHVYASNNATGSATPNYFVDHNKSPLPTYGQNAPPYYDTSKAPVVSKPGRVHDDYTALGPDTFNQNHYNGPYSPVPSPYPPNQSNYSQPQVSPQPESPVLPPTNSTQTSVEQKNTSYPVKKRTYNEPEKNVPATIIIEDEKETVTIDLVKPVYTNIPQPVNSIQQITSTSVDDIALALSEKSEISKANNLQDKESVDYTDNGNYRNKENTYEKLVEPTDDNKKEVHDVDLPKHPLTSKKENIDMINMGYMNASGRRISAEQADVEFTNASKTNPHQKGFEIEAIAINLGINNQHLSKPVYKSTNSLTNNTPAHAHERVALDLNTNQTIAHAHQNHYDPLPNTQAINNFSLNDIELANKKLFSCNSVTSTTAIDYGNWKATNQTRKPEPTSLPTDYSTVYSAGTEGKLKSSETNTTSITAPNYKHNMQHSQYNNYNNISRSNVARTQDLQQNLPAELRIPNPRGMHKNDVITVTSSISDSNSKIHAKSSESQPKAQKTEKHAQTHPLVSGLPYKTPYGSHTALPIETLRNLPNIPQMLERYSNDERYLQSFATGTSLYHDKTFQMAQMFNKSLASEVHPPSTSGGIYTQSSIAMSKDNNIYKASNVSSSLAEPKKNSKRRKTSETKQAQIVSSQSYHGSHNDVLTSVKTSMMPSSPFNFGSTANMTLGSMYGDNGGFTIEDFRNSTNQIMAANYMAAAVAHQQRNNEVNAEKLAKPAHQNSNHSAGSFPFLGTQVRAGYPFVGTEPSSPLYQQYFQRYQEELQRQTGAQIMGLYPPTYPTSLGVRQPYDSINRPSWL